MADESALIGLPNGSQHPGDNADSQEHLRLTEAREYDLATIRTGASFSLAAYLDLKQLQGGEKALLQCREARSVVLNDFRALHQYVKGIHQLARYRRWPSLVLLPLSLPPLTHALRWLYNGVVALIIARPQQQTYSSSPSSSYLGISPASPYTHDLSASRSFGNTSSTDSMWASLYDFFFGPQNQTEPFTHAAPGSTTPSLPTNDGFWNRMQGLAGSLYNSSNNSAAAEYQQQPLIFTWHDTSAWLVNTLSKPRVAFLSVGILASLYAIYNEMLIYSARRMSWKLDRDKGNDFRPGGLDMVDSASCKEGGMTGSRWFDYGK
ncbi:hypothetical protein V8F20_004356 [Naviculisporaceae sp. PSN 640]